MNSEICEATIISRSEEVLSSEMDGETIMLSINNGKYYAMTEHGTSIWRLLEKPRSIENLCKHLVKEFDVTYDECYNDTIEFLSELHDQQIILVN